MPFDTSQRRPTVTVLPPTPPEGGGGPRRIRIEIEIVDRRKPVPPRNRFGTFTIWLFVLLLLAAPAHAQPTSWQSYREGSVTRYEGTDANGGRWTGSSYEQWGTTFYDFHGPNGQSKHCRSWQQGGQTLTDCDR